MLLITIGVLLQLTTGQPASFGDFTIPSPSTYFEDSNVLFHFHVHTATSMLVVYAELKSYGYLGLLYSDVMLNVRFT